MTFMRVYNGTLSEGNIVHNLRTGKSEKAAKLFVAFADEFKPVSQAGPGSIVVVSGLKSSATGDVMFSEPPKGLVSPEGSSANWLPQVSIPDPVLYATIEAGSLSEAKKLDLALANIAREDPSLRVRYGSGTEPLSDLDHSEAIACSGDTITLSGMGELHLEVVLDRIRKEYKVDADLGPFMVTYLETLVADEDACVKATMEFDRALLDKRFQAALELELRPVDQTQTNDDPLGITAWKRPPCLKLGRSKPSQEDSSNCDLQRLKPWQTKALQRGFENAVSEGPVAGYPLVGVECVLHSLALRSAGSSSDTLLAAAMAHSVRELMKSNRSRFKLLEPVMKLTVTAERDQIPGIVQNVISRRRGWVPSEEENGSGVDGHESNPAILTATVMAPLSELRGYSTFLRRSTSGQAFFGMEFSHYHRMNETAQEAAIHEITGF